jgi:hypothetical protein
VTLVARAESEDPPTVYTGTATVDIGDGAGTGDGNDRGRGFLEGVLLRILGQDD